MIADCRTAALSRRRRRTPTLLLLAIALGMAAGLGLAVGATAIPPATILRLAFAAIGIGDAASVDLGHAMILTSVRLPRVALAMVVGAGLAVAGALMQAIFRNPLADPGLIGVSSGAALAAVALIVAGSAIAPVTAGLAGPLTLPLAAFAGGLAAVAIVFQVARASSHTTAMTLLLAGIAVNALSETGIGLFVFVSNDQQLRMFTFWRMGSLGGAAWASLLPVLLLIGAATALALRLAVPLNVYLLGEAESGHAGIESARLRRFVVVLVALAVGASVATSGVVAFVGLVVPHLVRLLVGPDHRILLPGAALLGATLLLAADLVARTVIAPAELPIGLVTGAIGAPFFIALLIRRDTLARG
ncbi:MAG: iron ABC transporter permease [Proteobacteria bacterium]|nr:iron ABC transporter permease [Pseudomonadota bacterium]